MTRFQTLTLLPNRYAVIKFEPTKPVYQLEGNETDLYAVIHTAEETTVVCGEQSLPETGLLSVEKGWRAMKVAGVLEFELVGILAALLDPLAKAGVSVFTLSTYSTDMILIKEERLDEAVKALKKAGHQIII
jgi:hypothetical protein